MNPLRGGDASYEKLPENAKMVGLKCFFALTKVNDIEHYVAFDLVVGMHWEESSSWDSSSNEQLQLCQKPAWVPDLEFYNYEKKDLTDEKYYKQGKVYAAFLNYSIETRQNFRFHKFPYDRQMIRLSFESERAKFFNWYSPLELPGWPDKGKETNYYGWFDSDLWDLRKMSVVYDDESGAVGPWRTDINIFAERKADFYLFNIGLVIFFLVLSSFSVHAIQTNSFSDRMSIIITLLLTVVAFKFVTSTWVPPVSYLTYLDKYTLLSVILLISMVAESYALSFGDGDDNEHIDKVFTTTIAVLWIALHVFIVIGTQLKWFYPSWNAAEERSSRSMVICPGGKIATA